MSPETLSRNRKSDQVACIRWRRVMNAAGMSRCKNIVLIIRILFASDGHLDVMFGL